MIKAILFDMDGVLIDAKDWHYEALNKALALFGHTISRADHLSTFDGLPTRTKLEMLSREHGLPRGLHTMLNTLKQKYTQEQVYTKCRPVFLHEYALSQLKLQGYKIGVASNSVRESVQIMMEKSNLIRYLDFYLSNEDIKRPKPEPDIYLHAAELAGAPPSQCLVVEDNANGVRAAEAAGCPVLVVETVADVRLAKIEQAIRRIEGVAP
jgi:beta-phosphoglucomutase-like phosphatase (HAD superfamily)